jgi:hypothetical protein
MPASRDIAGADSRRWLRWRHDPEDSLQAEALAQKTPDDRDCCRLRLNSPAESR